MYGQIGGRGSGSAAAAGRPRPRREDGSMAPLRVVVADDEPMLREGLVAVLDGVSGLQVVGVAADALEAIDLVLEHRPDVAVLDVNMPGGGGVCATRGIVACSPSTCVVAFTGQDDRSSIGEMLCAGAVSYVLKGARADELIDAIVRSARGESILSGQVAGVVVSELTGRLARGNAE